MYCYVCERAFATIDGWFSLLFLACILFNGLEHLQSLLLFVKLLSSCPWSSAALLWSSASLLETSFHVRFRFHSRCLFLGVWNSWRWSIVRRTVVSSISSAVLCCFKAYAIVYAGVNIWCYNWCPFGGLTFTQTTVKPCTVLLCLRYLSNVSSLGIHHGIHHSPGLARAERLQNRSKLKERQAHASCGHTYWWTG